MSITRNVIAAVRGEVVRQFKLWGQPNHPDGTGKRLYTLHADSALGGCEVAAKSGRLTWRLILDEEVKEAFAESDPAKLREELIQVAAVAVSWVEAIDRREA